MEFAVAIKHSRKIILIENNRSVSNFAELPSILMTICIKQCQMGRKTIYTVEDSSLPKQNQVLTFLNRLSVILLYRNQWPENY